MKTCPLILFMLLQLPAVAAEPAGSPPVSSGPPCQSRDLTFDSKEITCLLPPGAGRQRLGLTVNFSGGHDDTQASMTAFLDDKAFECETGSKTRLMGEDGDVSLVCLASIERASSGPLAFRLVVTWSHAQYTGFGVETH